jgi:hypothetical protein
VTTLFDVPARPRHRFSVQGLRQPAAFPMMTLPVVALFVVLIGTMARPVLADEAAPKLVFAGAVKDGGLSLTYDQLAALPTARMVEKVTTASQPSAFEGPELEQVLKLAGVGEGKIHASALDDYVVDIPLDMIRKYHPILAIRRDGKPITVDNLGPFLVMFPFAEHPEIDNDLGWTWAIWQLTKITVQ